MARSTQTAKTSLPSRLEMLTKTNQLAIETRKRKLKAPKPVKPSQQVESEYRAQLQSLIRAMAKDLYAEIEPELKRLKPQYIADAYVRDSWVSDILKALRKVSTRFSTDVFEAQVSRIASSTISRAEAQNAEEFRDSVNKAVGIDITRITQSPNMRDYLDASIASNVSLIKSIPAEYFQKIEGLVLNGMNSGLAPTAIAKQIQEETGSTYKRAKFIARDQMAKLNSDLTRKRQEEAGIEYYRSIESGDERVSGNPAGRYPKAKISCYGIARQDIGYGPGVYLVTAGAPWKGETGLHPGKHHPGCRCTAESLIEGVNYFPKAK